MRADALDIAIESRGQAIWLRLGGPFNNEQAPNIKEKILSLLADGNRSIIVHLEQVSFVDTLVPAMFLELLNTIRGKEGDLRFVYRNEVVTRAFAAFRNLLTVYPDEKALATGGLIDAVKRRTQVLFRRTGVRISRPVAFLLVVILFGWIVSLAYIIRLQGVRLREQSAALQELTQRHKEASLEIEKLTGRLRPMEQLGLMPDTSR